MNLDAEFEKDIRSKINQQYEDVLGTESYERKRLIGEIDRLRLYIENEQQRNASIKYQLIKLAAAPVRVERRVAQTGISAGADFENNTWTFEMPKGFCVGAGKYMIVKVVPNVKLRGMQIKKCRCRSDACIQEVKYFGETSQSGKFAVVCTGSLCRKCGPIDENIVLAIKKWNGST